MMRRPRLRRYPGPGVTASVFDAQVGVGADDGYIKETSTFNPTSNFVIIGRETSAPKLFKTWARFDPVTIPGGATVTAAKLIVVANSSANDGVEVLSNIALEAADDPAAPSDEADFLARTRTTAKVAWDGVDFVIDVDTDSPDITGMVQEVLDRGGWNSGQAMQILWDDDGTATNNKYYNLYSYEGTGEAIKLHVEYLA